MQDTNNRDICENIYPTKVFGPNNTKFRNKISLIKYQKKIYKISEEKNMQYMIIVITPIQM